MSMLKPFETLRERALAALPASQEFVALHSNPGPLLVAFFPDREEEATRDLRQSLSDL